MNCLLGLGTLGTHCYWHFRCCGICSGRCWSRILRLPTVVRWQAKVLLLWFTCFSCQRAIESGKFWKHIAFVKLPISFSWKNDKKCKLPTNIFEVFHSPIVLFWRQLNGGKHTDCSRLRCLGSCRTVTVGSMKWWSWLNLVALNYYYYWNIPIEVYPTISPSELEFWICTAVMISDVQYWEVPTGRGRIHNLRSAIPCGPCVWPDIELSRTR